MVDAMVIDVVKKPMKRKRAELEMSKEKIESRIGGLRDEIDSLFKYYNEGFNGNELMNLNSVKGTGSGNTMIACLLEETRLPLSKLVESIFENVKEKYGSMTIASVKSSVISIGQRCFYGVQNLNADVLEDESDSCLWSWETRDVKLLPKSVRGAIKIRRTCRKKIHERITDVSALITELMKPESASNGGQKITKASERLTKVLSEVEIRSLVEKKMEQKIGADVAEIDVKLEEKLVVKQLEKNNKKKQRKNRGGVRKKKLNTKKQLALQKQTSILERFLIKSKISSPMQVDQSTIKESATNISPKQTIHVPESVVQSMDSALSVKDAFDTKELKKVHLDSWHQLSHSGNRKRHWGIRRTPKTVVVKELKLTSKGEEDPSVEKFDDNESKNDCRSFNNANADGSVIGSQECRRKQLLQFDKSHRPTFYGYWPKKRYITMF